jgi:hypothetical protein
MGSLWVDPPRDDKIYPMQGQPVLPFDENALTKARRFPDEQLGADFRSMLFLIDFSQTDWMTGVTLPRPPGPDSQDMKDALKELVLLQEKYREKALPEILAQNSEFQLYFCSQLGIYPETHPQSYLMLKIVARIGELVMAKLKRWHGAPRPSQIYPRLTPPVPVPQHGSYPSGHALISWLMARMAGEIEPTFKDPAQKLALRIARNREIAGLHFWWDGKGGASAADQTFDKYIVKLDDYDECLAAATAEWQSSFS